MNKFEKLIEYVINEEDGKAEELFHEIVVDKSRDIYESLMNAENELGGDEADELINDISSDEEGMSEDDEKDIMAPEMGADDYSDKEEMGADEYSDKEMGDMAPEAEEELEDRVVNLEDQLDALMAEFDSVMGDAPGEEMGDMGADDYSDKEEMGDMGADDYSDKEEMGMEGRFNEAVSLSKVTTGIANTTEEESVNKKCVNADNSGKKGAVAKPHQEVGEEGKVADPAVKPGDGTTEPRESKVAEPKKKGEDADINKKSLNS